MILGNSDLYKARESYVSPTIKRTDGDESLFVESLNILAESDRFFLNELKSMHSKAIIAHEDTLILQEFNFKTFVQNIIHFFIDAIKTIFAKFKNLFQRFLYSDKTIWKYESKIKNIKHSFDLSFERYIYTVSDPYIPNINLKTEFNDKYDDLLSRLERMSKLKTSQERINKMQSIESEIYDEINNHYYDTVRKRIINSSHLIADNDYSKELFNVFRDGGNMITTKVDATECTVIFDRYKDNKKILKDTEKLQNDTIASAKAVEKKINKLTLGEINKYYKPINDNEEMVFNKILRATCGQVNNVCNLYVMAFSAKCDAIKESAQQDKKVLFEAIKYINLKGDEA